jgi:outer membrane protein OmpA-like peptidoglycan-associated protein
MARRVAVAWALILLAAAVPAAAQTGSSGTSTAQNQSGTQTSSSATSTETGIRPATTTFFGDTGLWFVPTGEVLPHGKWSVSGYRRGTNYTEGFTNVGDFAGTFGVGIRDRAEIFGSFLFDTRIDRDLRPLFSNDAKYGGVVDRYPRVNRGWSGDNVGDFYLGAKYNFWSEYRQKPAAIALRGMFKAPTGDDDAGAGTGKPDFILDGVFSKEYAARGIEVSGNVGWEFRGSPDDIEIPGGAFRWGIGAALGSRSALRGTLELNGSTVSGDTTTPFGTVVGIDGSIAPLTTDTKGITRATAGLTWQAKNGFFIGGGISMNLPMKDRGDGFVTDDDSWGSLGDFSDWQVRLGFHPGVRVYVPPPPPTPTPTPTPAPVAPANRPPTVTAACDPSLVEPGGRCTVTANAQDPDGDMLTYRWSAPSGTFQNPAERQTQWTASQQEGTVPLTVTVEDGKGGKAQATANVQVQRPPVKQYTFEDVHFDFDRSTLRAEAQRVLDEAVKAMQADPALRLQIEGHTCNIGTAEYNLALGDRRASSVRDYLASRGIAANRLSTVSYGEERPKHDNSREETRRLNRRAALTVNLTK